jgi:hypothetical protein
MELEIVPLRFNQAEARARPGCPLSAEQRKTLARAEFFAF